MRYRERGRTERERERGRDVTLRVYKERCEKESLLPCSAVALLLSSVVTNNQTCCMHEHGRAFPPVDVADRAPICCCLRRQLNK